MAVCGGGLVLCLLRLLEQRLLRHQPLRMGTLADLLAFGMEQVQPAQHLLQSWPSCAVQQFRLGVGLMYLHDHDRSARSDSSIYIVDIYCVGWI